MSFFRKNKNPFFKNVLTLMTGTSIAQAIPIALSPVLTRIYSPEEFGLFAIYSGLASVLIVISTGRYELAIMLTKKDSEAADLVKLATFISIIISLISFFSILFFGKKISILLGDERIYYWLFLIPISLFVNGVYQSLNYWFNRKKDFKRLAKNRVMQSSITGFSQTIFGIIKTGGIGLLFGTLLGQILTLISLLKKISIFDRDFFNNFEISKIIILAKRYINFPKLDVPTAMLNVGAMHAPNILFSTFYSGSFAGFYYLTQRVLQAPITLISTSVLDVFKEEASKTFRETGQAKAIFLNTFKWLFIMSITPSIILFFIIEDLFAWVFGADWKIAGEYAKIMIPALSIRFIANPLSFLIYIAEKQIWNLITMIGLAIGVFFSFYFSENHYQVIFNISITYIFYYLTHLFLGALFAGVFRDS